MDIHDLRKTDGIVKKLHREAAQMLAEEEDEVVIDFLVKERGVSRSYAEMILENVRNDEDDKKRFTNHFFGGIFTFLAGLTLTIGTYRMATVSGGIYIIFTGLMVYGIYNVTRAVILFRK